MTLRIGCVKYLNARPLIAGWQAPVDFDTPASLCAKLARGDLDVALVSSFEYLRNPIYTVVDDIAIASDGPVFSVGVAHREPLACVERIATSGASATSNHLLQCLVAELGINTGLTNDAADARLLIGDDALRFRTLPANGWQFWDLGAAWRELMGLPFVFALWLVRPEVGNVAAVAEQLRELRQRNLARLPELADEQTEFTPEFCVRYWQQNLDFNFGPRHKEGLANFHSLCIKHAVLPEQSLQLKTA